MAKKENMMEKVGGWLFILGVIIAILAGLFASDVEMIPPAMAVIGLIVGILNVTDKEVNNFIIASIGLMLAATALATLAGFFGESGQMVYTMFATFGIFVSGAVIFPALKVVYGITRD